MSDNFYEGKLKIQVYKTIIAIALILIMTTTVLITGMQFANAAVVEIDTYSYAMVSPNPVGVGQQAEVSLQLDKVSPTAVGLAGGDHFKGITCKITKPDGTTETKGPFEAWAMSGAFFYYIPIQVGNYTFQMNFPGQWINKTSYESGNYFSYWFKPSASAIATVTVQQNAIPQEPNVPLPTGYWTRPVYGENKGWSQVADNWLMKRYDRPSRFFSGDSAFAPYTSAPNSAHVLWNKPIIFGGIAGGPWGDKTYYTGLSYEQFYTPLIINGRIIYTDHGPSSWGDRAAGSIDPFGDMGYGTYCIDLQTGQQIWFMNNTNILLAQLYDIENPNEHGLIASLWEVFDPAATDGAFLQKIIPPSRLHDPAVTVPTPYANYTWRMYDAFTGRYILTIKNIPMANPQSNTIVFGPSGELLVYTLDWQRDRLIMWNSSKALYYGDFYAPERYNPITGAVIDGQLGIQWNVSTPNTLVGNHTIRMISLKDGIMLTAWESVGNWSEYTTYPGVIQEAAFDTKTGQLLWVQNRTNIAGRIFYSKNIEDGIYTRYDSPTMKIYGYDIKTGQELWVTEPISKNGWAYFTYMHHIAYGKLYVQGYDGYIRAFDLKTGKLVWETYFGSVGTETPYGTLPSYTGFTIADGKIYSTNDDHSPDSVVWRGGKLWTIDAETGKILWNISGWLRNPAIADGILTALNSLDGQVYTLGKGPSKTTVSAPQAGVSVGRPIAITGTVTDQSTGQPDTPAIADEYMSAWMEYLHMQKPIPGEAKGVPVLLTAVDPNGLSVTIGTATSDMGGSYGIAWTPAVEGTYQIMATFAGTNSYGESYATTYLVVGPAAASPLVPTSTPPTTSAPVPTTSPSPAIPPTEGPSTALYVAVAAAVTIIAITASAVILRRRK